MEIFFAPTARNAMNHYVRAWMLYQGVNSVAITPAYLRSNLISGIDDSSKYIFCNTSGGLANILGLPYVKPLFHFIKYKKIERVTVLNGDRYPFICVLLSVLKLLKIESRLVVHDVTAHQGAVLDGLGQVFSNINWWLAQEKITHQDFGPRLSSYRLAPHPDISHLVPKHFFPVKPVQSRFYDLVFVGRLEPYKNLSFFFDVSEHLISLENWQILIVGSGSQMGQVVQFANKLPQNVSYKGFLPDFELYECLTDSKVALLPYFKSSASGLPFLMKKFQVELVCSNSGPLADLALSLNYTVLELRLGALFWAQELIKKRKALLE